MNGPAQIESSWSRDQEDGGPTIQLPAAESRCTLRSSELRSVYTRVSPYPLSQATDPPATTFVDASGTLFDSTIRYDLSFFESLNTMVQAEPWLERDKAMIDPLKRVGIERGQPFAPDAKTKAIFADAILEAGAWFEARYNIIPPFYEGKRWFFPSIAEMIQSVMKDWHVPVPIRSMRAAPPIPSRFSVPNTWVSRRILFVGRSR